MARTTTVINFSAPPALAKMIAQRAKQEKKTKSELLRDAFQGYLFDQKLKEFQEVGRVLAQKLGLESYDDIEDYFG